MQFAQDSTLELLLAESIRQALIHKEGAHTMKPNGISHGAEPPRTAPLAAEATPLPTTPLITSPNHTPDVYRAINQVAKAISRDGIAKGRQNQQQGYGFRGIDDVMNALSALLAGAGLLILPRMSSRTQEERSTAKGGVLFYVTVQADFDFVSVIDGSSHVVTMYGEAMDSADKATNKAMSAAYKYCCLQVFCIPTEGMADDADLTTHQPVPRPMKANPPTGAGEPRELRIVPDAKPWTNKGECKRAFLALRAKLGSVVFEEELGRFFLTDADIQTGNFKSGLHAAEAFQALIACAEAKLGVQ